MDKVKELVEWVAGEMDIDCALCVYSPSSSYSEKCFDVPETTPCKRRMDVARQILSHPDLCLIDRDRELPENRYADDYYAGSGARPAAYEKAWQDALKAGYLPVIPLAQALEVKDES